MVLPPHRVKNHVIDEKACKIVSIKLGEEWVERDVTGRDFGIDKIIERFEGEYATSEIMMLQIKGTESVIDENNPRLSISTKTLLYAEWFASPFILIYCSINNPQQCYYLWLQEYIRIRLNFENDNWRNQEENTVYFPKKNILGSEESMEHLKYISLFPKFKDCWIQYYLCLEDLGYNMPEMLYTEDTSLEEYKEYVEGIADSLERALEKAKYIPEQFIASEIPETITIAKNIMDATEIPDIEDFIKLALNCMLIKESMAAIALRFDEKSLRIHYECEGTADF